MLLPDNIHPENTVYFNAAFVIEALSLNIKAQSLNLYLATVKIRKMSISLFLLCLDWLYLLDMIFLNEKGEIELCS